MASNIHNINDITVRIASEGEKVLPVDGEENILITSALPYCNNVPHLGNLIGSTLSADVFARYNRGRNRRTLYICGTDEYGTATETQAIKERVTPQELCDKYYKLHVETYDWFELQFDLFGRTSTPRHDEICQEAIRHLHENNLLEEQTKDQFYCEVCPRFLADRFVEGTCPHCGFDDARGDQCDSCSRTLDPTELRNPRCLFAATHEVKKEVGPRPSTHLYVKLNDIEEKTKEWIKEAWRIGKWSPNSVINAEGEIIDARLKAGLKPSPLTRDLEWGVRVPPELKGFEHVDLRNKVLYVWFDAPFGYPSITANYTPEWKKWWFNRENVKLYQFMGKDNVYFHSVFWPSILLGDGRPWTTLHHLSTTEYLQYESGKFSKSRGTGVFGAAAKHTGVPPSVWRYYLLSTRPETADSTFSWNDFVAANNNVLLNNFGNFVNRVLKFTQSKYSEGGVSKVPASNDPPGPIATTEIEGDPDPTFVSEINALLTEFINAMDAVKLRLGLQTVMLISARGNLYLQRSLLSNALFEEQPQRCAEVVSRSINLIYALSALIQPFMPSTSQSILEQLNAPPRIIPDKLSNNILSGHQLGKPAYLFTRIDPKKADEWRAMFGGNAPASAPTPVSKRKAVAAAKKEANTLGDIEKTSEILDLEAKIKAQGDKVRQIKEKKEPNIAEEVAVLKKLKENLQEVISKLPNVSTT